MADRLSNSHMRGLITDFSTKKLVRGFLIVFLQFIQWVGEVLHKSGVIHKFIFNYYFVPSVSCGYEFRTMAICEIYLFLFLLIVHLYQNLSEFCFMT